MRRLAVLAALACVLGLTAGLIWPPPAIPRAQLVQQDTWSLPGEAALERLSPEDMQRARSGLRWIGEGDPAEGGAATGPWQLLGLVEGPEPMALLMASGQVQRFARGASLPDGRAVLAIERSRITVGDEACKETYRLYDTKPVDRSGTCPEQPGE